MEKNSRGKKTRGRRRAGRSFEFLSGCQGSPSDMWTKVWRRWEGELWQYLGIRRGKSKNRSYEVGICRVCWKNSQNARMRRGWAGGGLGGGVGCRTLFCLLPAQPVHPAKCSAAIQLSGASRPQETPGLHKKSVGWGRGRWTLPPPRFPLSPGIRRGVWSWGLLSWPHALAPKTPAHNWWFWKAWV